MSTVALPSGHKVCHNHMSYTYTGKESTPQGLGYCAEAEDIGKVMTGRDKHMWTVGIKNAMKVWVRIPDQMVAKKEVAPMAAPIAPIVAVAPEPEEKSSDSEEPENEVVASEPEEEPEQPVAGEPVAPPAPKKKAAPKPKPVPAVEPAVEAAPAPKKKAAPKKKPMAAANADSDTASQASTASVKPKRAPTAFNLYVKDKIAELRKTEPGLPQKEYMSKAAAAWNDYKAANGMPETKPKAPKAPKAEADPNAPVAPKPTAKKKGKAVVDDDAQSQASTTASEKKKRAPSAYNIFIKEKMAELRAAEPGLQAKEYMSKAAALYRESKPVA